MNHAHRDQPLAIKIDAIDTEDWSPAAWMCCNFAVSIASAHTLLFQASPTPADWTRDPIHAPHHRGGRPAASEGTRPVAMASRGGNGGGSSMRAWAESNARLLVLGVVGLGASFLGLFAARQRGLLQGGLGMIGIGRSIDRSIAQLGAWIDRLTDRLIDVIDGLADRSDPFDPHATHTRTTQPLPPGWTGARGGAGSRGRRRSRPRCSSASWCT